MRGDSTPRLEALRKDATRHLPIIERFREFLREGVTDERFEHVIERPHAVLKEGFGASNSSLVPGQKIHQSALPIKWEEVEDGQKATRCITVSAIVSFVRFKPNKFSVSIASAVDMLSLFSLLTSAHTVTDERISFEDQSFSDRLSNIKLNV